MYFRIQRNSFLISFWCEGSYRSFSPIDMYPEYIFILENIQREIETICTKKHYKYGNYYNFTNPLDVRLKGFSQVEGGTRDQREWVFEVREVKSENKKLSLFFEKCKVKKKCFHSFSRSAK